LVFLVGKLTEAGLIPVLVLAVSVGFVSLLDPFGKWAFNPPNLTLILNALFLTGTGIIVAAVSAKSYLRQGNLNILLLGSAVLVSGLASLAAGRVLSVQTPNYSVTIHNVGFLVSSILQIISAALIFLGIRSKVFIKRRFVLTVSYSVTVLFVIILTVLTLLGLTPTFFMAEGPTLLRQSIVAITIILFTLSCLILFRSYLQSKSKVLYWYSLALGLFAIGFLSLTLQNQAGDGFSWVSKIAQYTGGFYFVLAVLSSRTKEASAGFTENWAEAFRSNREQFSTLFRSMLDAFIYGKIVVDKEGKPVDWIYLDNNEAHERMLGLKKEQIIGKRVSELFPEEHNDPTDWIGRYGRVAITGEPFHFEGYRQSMKKWLHVSSYSPKKGYFVAIFEDVTERKKAEEALRKSEEEYGSLFANMMDGIAYCQMIFDEKGKPVDFVYLQINDAFESITGLKRESIVGKKVTEAIPGIKEANPELFEIYGRVAVTCQKEKFEVFFKPLSMWLSISVYCPTKGHFVAVFEDITERMKTEEALASANKELEERVRKRTEEVSTERQRLYSILETLPAYVILLDKDYRVPFANKVFRERFGESHGRRCYEYLFKHNASCEICETYKVLKTNKPHHWEWNGPDGRDYDIYDFPFVEADGSTLILEMGIDITERKRAEKKLRAAYLYSRSLIEASLDPLVTISVEGKITDVNQATELATGCTREELIGSDFSEYFTEPEKAKIGYKQVFTEGFVRDYPLAIRHKSGTITDVLYNASIYTNQAGEMQGVFAAARDITELRKAEEQAQEAAKKLKDSERLAAIGATAGMVGHDIRNPLQAITSDVYLAKTDLASTLDSEEKKNALESLDEIEKNVVYINKIVADLQDFARQITPVAKETNLKSVVDDILTKSGIPSNIKVKVKVQKEAGEVMADPDILKRVLGNLVTNAVQAMPQGGHLSINGYLEAKDVVITVKDTGVGIPEEARSKLFTPLFTTKSKGQGFGLAVVKRMTEALGGSVTFESEVGKGTTFILRFPPRAKR
jgi:PAS domain S-box-containing protein